MDTKEKFRASFVTAVDPVELACRLIESGGMVTRPEGLSAHQAFAALDEIDQKLWMGAAEAALNYFSECISELRKPS